MPFLLPYAPEKLSMHIAMSPGVAGSDEVIVLSSTNVFREPEAKIP